MTREQLQKEIRKAQNKLRYCRNTGEEKIRRQHVAAIEYDPRTGLRREFCVLCDETFDVSVRKY